MKVKIVVAGRVQGVSFRYFTKQVAVNLTVKGTVQNLDSGQVEIIAYAEERILNEFINEIKKGPSPWCKVEDFQVEKLEQSEATPLSFEIVY